MRRLLTETPRASLTSVGRSSVCLSVWPEMCKRRDRAPIYMYSWREPAVL